MEFAMDSWAQNRHKPKQKFGNPKIIKAGEEIDVRTWIEEGREDTEIYPTLEKYGCLDRMILNKEKVFGDMTEIMDLRDSIEQVKKADALWEKLPLDFRREFQGDKHRFMKEGLDVLKKKIDAEKEKLNTKEKETE